MTDLSSQARKLITRASQAGGPSGAQRHGMKKTIAAAMLAPVAAAAAAGGATGYGMAATVVAAAISISVGAGATWVVMQSAKPPVTPRATLARQSTVESLRGRRPDAIPPASLAPDVPPEPVVSALPPVTAAKARTAEPSFAQRTAPLVEPERFLQPPRAAGEKGEASAAILALEVEALVDAMRAIDESSFDEALARLERYRREFPTGQLAIEERVLRVLGLCGAGRVTEAKQLSASLEGSANPAVRRLDRSCVSVARSNLVQGDDK